MQKFAEESSVIIEDTQIFIKLTNDQTRSFLIKQNYFLEDVLFLKRVLFPEETNSGLAVRLIYQGRLMEDNEKLISFGIKEGNFIHAVMNPPNSNENIENITVVSIADLPQSNILTINNSNNNINNNNNSNLESIIVSQNRRGFEKFIDSISDDEPIERLREMYHVGYRIDNYALIRDEMYCKEESLIATKYEEVKENYLKLKKRLKDEEAGTWNHFLIGLILGYFFNILVLLVIGILKGTKKILMGTLVGFSVYILIVTFKSWDNYGNVRRNY